MIKTREEVVQSMELDSEVAETFKEVIDNIIIMVIRITMIIDKQGED